MRQHVLAQLLHAPRDLDYVGRFQALQSINLEMRRSGPTVHRLLRKGILEMECGNFAAGLAAAKDAAVLEPDNCEAHYQIARAYVFLALAKADGISFGPGLRQLPGESATSLVLKARHAFQDVARLNGADAEARRDLEVLDEILAQADDEERLIVLLRRAGV